jgi:hypothetical protein
MDQPDLPWIRIASANIGVERDHVLEFFPSSLGFQALYPREVPVRLKAGPDASSIQEVASWVVNFGPTLFRQIAFWSLVVYGGKKLMDGMVTEAGKDLWKGLKAFIEFVYQKVQEKRAVLRERGAYVDIVSRSDTHSDAVWIRIALPSTINELEQIVSQLQEFVFPLVGCFPQESKETGHLDMEIHTAHELGWDWIVHGKVGFRELLST